jgi:gamma-glutamyl hercynylcysteine S-oxide synthase
MHLQSLTEECPAAAVRSEADRARTAGPVELARMLNDSRQHTLSTFDCYLEGLPDLKVPLREELNPPLWELGHVGWFQEYWIGRNPQRRLGVRADPDVLRAAPRRAGSDSLYHSGRVAHRDRWSLALPGVDEVRADLSVQLQDTLGLLDTHCGVADDDSLYFHRLCLFHEDMHHEASLYMAQVLGLTVPGGRWAPHAMLSPPSALAFDETTWTLGVTPDSGFRFDNEMGCLDVRLPAALIDAQVVRWAEFLPFIEAGGYRDSRWWSPQGLAWLQASELRNPRYLRREGGQWWEQRYGAWRALDPAHPASHLTLFEAQAWCRWAGRRLPSEAEWERAALDGGRRFRWGDVWEWTASAFSPYPGFEAHPYRDYSAPWFDGRPVLRGASFMTQPRIRHPRYRNYFCATRNDVAAGFRSCVA